jgi:hypothetical protein
MKAKRFTRLAFLSFATAVESIPNEWRLGTLQDLHGNNYALVKTRPHVQLFSSNFLVKKNGTVVMNIRTGERFPVTVYRAAFEKETIVQIVNDGRAIAYAEIRHAKGVDDTFFLPNENETESLNRFSANDIGEAGLLDSYSEPLALLRIFSERSLRGGRQMLPEFVYQSGDGTRTSAESCTFFKVVKVAIVYDAEFCALYGSTDATRNRILGIVASASLYYERDMCVRLELDEIYSPDDCSGESNTFGQFTRHVACGTTEPHLLGEFAVWMTQRRRSFGIYPGAIVHYITGYPSPGTLGCAYLGTLCWDAYSYGVSYLGAMNHIRTQGQVLAHELGHNLNAPHLEGSGEHIMRSKLSRGTDGFSRKSIEKILSFLDSPDMDCDGIWLESATSQTSNTANKTTNRPSSNVPTNISTLKPSLRQCIEKRIEKRA